jgi:hypothetical protein
MLVGAVSLALGAIASAISARDSLFARSRPDQANSADCKIYRKEGYESRLA